MKLRELQKYLWVFDSVTGIVQLSVRQFKPLWHCLRDNLNVCFWNKSPINCFNWIFLESSEDNY